MKKLLLVLVILVLGALAAGMVMPTDYRLERKAVIAADSAKIHQWVADLKRWDEWTPWKEADPESVTTFGTTTSGLGASQTWTGSDGDGELTIVDSSPDTGIAYDMAFIDGDTRVPAKGAIRYRGAQGGGTEVIWTMEGDTEKMGVLRGWFAMLMPSMVGPYFDKGLEKLKVVVEKG
jgi:hypothetical protein